MYALLREKLPRTRVTLTSQLITTHMDSQELQKLNALLDREVELREVNSCSM